MIDGRALKVSLTKKDVQVFGAVRLWDKTKRNTLTPEARLHLLIWRIQLLVATTQNESGVQQMAKYTRLLTGNIT